MLKKNAEKQTNFNNITLKERQQPDISSLSKNTIAHGNEQYKNSAG
jgi:hypothetical protein